MSVVGADDLALGPLLVASEEVDRLSDDIAELALLAEDVFKNASAALYVPDAGAVHAVVEAADECARMHYALNQRALTVLGLVSADPDLARRIVELQQSAVEFARIATASREIAEHALALCGSAENDLLEIGVDAPALLVHMLRQAYVELRASVVASATRDTVMARRIIAEDGELQRLYLMYKGAIERAIGANPRNAARLSRLVLVGLQLHDIGSHVVAIARALLYAPPQILH